MRSTLGLALPIVAVMTAGAIADNAVAESDGRDQEQIEAVSDAGIQPLLYRDRPYDWDRRDWREPPYRWRRDFYRRYDQRPYTYRYRGWQPRLDRYDRYDRYGRAEPWRRGYGGQPWWQDRDRWAGPWPPRRSQNWYAREAAPFGWRQY